MTDNTANDPGFDPRFDPAFQPGYDPSRHAAPQRKNRPRPTEDLVPAPAAPEQGNPEPILPRPAQGAEREDRPALRLADPLLVTLWALSAVFVASGIYALKLIADRVAGLTSSGGFGGPDYYLLQAYTALAPLLIVLGLATATGTIFLLAARRHRVAPPVD